MPTLTQLEYALAVEKHRHFGEAAKRCHVTQPTLSQQLQKLEDELGVILFDRLKKPILATPEGSAFLAQAKIVLREHTKLLDVAKIAKDGAVSGEFRLAIIPTVASELLPVFLKPFSKTYPGVELYIEELKTDTIVAELANDSLDGAILATPLAAGDFKTHPLYYEDFYAYFAPGHTLLKQSKIARKDLDPTQMWLLRDGHCFKKQVADFCLLPTSSDAVLGNVHFQSGSLETLRKLVHESGGYTLIPAMMALGLNKSEQSQVRPFKDPVPTREISLIYRRDHWKLSILAAIEKVISENLPPSIAQRLEKHHRVIDVC